MGMAQEQRAEQVADPGPGREEQREEQEEQHDAGAEVALGEAEHDEHAGDEEVREEADGEEPHLLPLPGERVGQVEDQRHLGHLGRLEAHRPEVEPAPRPAGGAADPRDEHQHEREEGDEEERDGQDLEPAVARLDHRGEQGDADGAGDQLALQEVELVVDACLGGDRARRVDHHRAERREQQHRPEEHPVDAGRTRRRGVAGGLAGRAHGRASSSTRRRKTSPRSS